jgi:sporulation protein YlmC with PRC-barrel domain
MTKTKFVLSAAGAMAYALALSTGSFAADTGSMSNRASDSQSYGAYDSSKHWGELASLDKLEGTKVHDSNGDNAGKISDIVFDPSSGSIRYFVLASGGMLGIGEKKYAVPYQAFQFRTNEDYLTLSIDKERLKNAPEARSDLAYDPDFDSRLDQYYGVGPATGGTMGAGTASDTRSQAARSGTEDSMTKHDHWGFASSEHVKGMKVMDSKGEDIGKISDVVFEPSSGRIGYFVVASGGALGVGEKKYAVPFHAFTWNPDRKTLALNVDKEKFKNAPEARSDMTYDRDFATRVDQYFGVSPSWERDSHGGMHREMHKDMYKDKEVQDNE